MSFVSQLDKAGVAFHVVSIALYFNYFVIYSIMFIITESSKVASFNQHLVQAVNCQQHQK